jgi:hypothetical protein
LSAIIAVTFKIATSIKATIYGISNEKAGPFLTLPSNLMINADYLFLNFLLNPASPNRL